MVIVWMVAGAALGALSRLEETTPGLDGGISSSTAWLAAAFVVGALAVRAVDAAGAGAVTLTFANLGYYGWVAMAEPGRPLRAVAGPIDRWFELGVAGGAVFGLLGCACRRGRPWLRAGSALLLVGVLVFETLGLRTSVLGPSVP